MQSRSPPRRTETGLSQRKMMKAWAPLARRVGSHQFSARAERWLQARGLAPPKFCTLHSNFSLSFPLRAPCHAVAQQRRIRASASPRHESSASSPLSCLRPPISDLPLPLCALGELGARKKTKSRRGLPPKSATALSVGRFVTPTSAPDDRAWVRAGPGCPWHHAAADGAQARASDRAIPPRPRRSRARGWR